nr:hypothetical protein [Paenibacillus bovis]
MFRLPFLFIITGIIGFVFFQATTIISLSDWMMNNLRGPTGWFQTHLFVLGWATMLAMGAVYQLINVILQSKIYSERLGYIHYIFFTVGLIGLLYGFYFGKVMIIASFASLTFIGILLFAWNMGVTLIRASKWDAITISAACAVAYLVLTGFIGMAMGVNFYMGIWGEFHENLFRSHIWLGTVGWFGLLITGFSYKMLPMFYLSHQYPTNLQTVTLILWNSAVVLGAINFLIDGGFWISWLALFILTAAIVVYNIHLLQIKKYRNKRNPGLGIKWSVFASQAFLVLVIGLLIYSILFPEQLFHAKTITIAGWIYLGGWVSFTILCYASKIVPFLWWTHKYGKHAGKPGIPLMADLLDEKKVQIGLAIVAGFFLLLLTGLFMEASIIIAIGGTILSLVSILYIGLIGFVFAR